MRPAGITTVVDHAAPGTQSVLGHAPAAWSVTLTAQGTVFRNYIFHGVGSKECRKADSGSMFLVSRKREGFRL